MKNKTIVFGCIISCLILLMLPNITATQYQLTKDVIEDKPEEIQESFFIKLEDYYPIICSILFLLNILILSFSFTFMALAVILQSFYLTFIFGTISAGLFTFLYFISNFITYQADKLFNCRWCDY
ncbi:unnamed protein product [marine sediment metagenome]|uniref:Uncharacterized protein n=1 Tax=marine sediment metagenome TaxID=412755 RepID=X0VXJ0_9ZZZZ